MSNLFGPNSATNAIANASGAFTNTLNTATDAAADLPAAEKKGRKKKPKKEKDPNAPKRPLTAFFLYSQSARPIVKSDVPEGTKASEVNEEILRRWNEMGEDQKTVSSVRVTRKCVWLTLE